MYPKSHNSNGTLLNTKVVPFTVLKRSIQFLIHLLFKKFIRPLAWSGPKIEPTSHLFKKYQLDYLKSMPLFSRMFFHDFGFESSLTKKNLVPISDSCQFQQKRCSCHETLPWNPNFNTGTRDPHKTGLDGLVLQIPKLLAFNSWEKNLE